MAAIRQGAVTFCGTVAPMASGETDLRNRGSAQAYGQTTAGRDAARPVLGDVPAEDVLADGSDAQLSDAMACVSSFHEAFNLPRASRPRINVPADLAKLRVDLLVEETGEFADATASRDIVGMADALADIVYVAYGAAVTYGIDLDAALREVHRSNMSKLDEHGQPVYREDGKVLKSAQYTPPDIAGVLSRQPPLPF